MPNPFLKNVHPTTKKEFWLYPKSYMDIPLVWVTTSYHNEVPKIHVRVTQIFQNIMGLLPQILKKLTLVETHLKENNMVNTTHIQQNEWEQ